MKIPSPWMFAKHIASFGNYHIIYTADLFYLVLDRKGKKMAEFEWYNKHKFKQYLKDVLKQYDYAVWME